MKGYTVHNNRGENSYWLRVQTHESWQKIAICLEYKSKNGARQAAAKYANSNHLPWPVNSMTKGDAAYRARRVGMTWLAIGRRYQQTASSIRRCAYKHAQRNNLRWPPEYSNE